MNDVRRVLGFLAPYRWTLAAAALGVVLVGALRLIFPLAGRYLTDIVLAHDAVPLDQRYQELNWFCVALLGLLLVQTAVNVAQNYLLTSTGERVVADLRKALYRRLMGLDLQYFSEHPTGAITSRLTNDVTAVQGVVTQLVPGFLTEVMTFVGSLVLIIYLNAQLAAVMLAVIPPVVLAARFFGKRLRSISTQVQDRLAESTSLAEEATMSVRVVKAFGREPEETSRYGDAVGNVLAAAVHRARLRAMLVPIITTSGFGGLVLVSWYGGRLLLAGTMSPGDMVAFLFFTVMIAANVGSFAGVYTQFQEALGALRRLVEILDAESTVIDREQPQPLPLNAQGTINGVVRFENAGFEYEPGRPVLSDLSLEIGAGEVLALVGPSGGGKSTLVNLIPRFYDPTVGRLTLDGIDLRELSLADLRGQVGLVPQETQLFARTVRENILYGRPTASAEEVEQAARAAHAHEFIERLPQGYDTLVGERGTKLSGGQRQRIAIARTLLKDPRVLLLDEATSALDSESEAVIQDALQRLLEGRTTIIIAHRLATVQLAHRVAVIDNGRLVELGSHRELLAQGGLYAHLHALQFREAGRGVGAVVAE